MEGKFHDAPVPIFLLIHFPKPRFLLLFFWAYRRLGEMSMAAVLSVRKQQFLVSGPAFGIPINVFFLQRKNCFFHIILYRTSSWHFTQIVLSIWIEASSICCLSGTWSADLWICKNQPYLFCIAYTSVWPTFIGSVFVDAIIFLNSFFQMFFAVLLVREKEKSGQVLVNHEEPGSAKMWTCWQKEKLGRGSTSSAHINWIFSLLKMALSIRFRFKAMTARRHSSAAAEMPLLRIFEMQFSRFRTAKLPSAQIFRSRIME